DSRWSGRVLRAAAAEHTRCSSRNSIPASARRGESWFGRCAMKLGSAIQEYTDYKRSLGMDFRTDATRLRAFLRQTGDVEIDSISDENVQAYLKGRGGPVTSFWFNKYHALDRFFRYAVGRRDRKSTRLNSSHVSISYAVFCLK